MKRWKKVIAGTGLGLLFAASVPIMPETQTALVWWEPYPGAETCFARYKDGEERTLPCSQYWTIAKTANYPQPARTEFMSMLSGYLAKAAIAFDAASNDADALGDCEDAVSSLSWSHTTSGADRLLFVGVSATDATDANSLVSSVTYNSVSMTEAVERQCTTCAGTIDYTASAWYLAGPATGSNTVSVTLGGTSDYVCGGAISLTGVDQSSPLDATNSGIVNSGATITTDVTTVADNAWVLDVVVSSDSAADLAPGGGQTQRWEYSNVFDNFTGGGSNEGPKTPAGAVTMSWTHGATEDGAIAAASFKPATGGGAATYDDTHFELLDN